jgi:hypothetical protein
MRARVGSDDAPDVPPAALTDYLRWCAAQGVAPYGHPAAVSQWSEWERARARWAAERGLVEDDLPTSGCSAPFDIDAI